MSGTHASQIIWHRVQAIAGQKERSIEAVAFVGQVLYASGERGTWIIYDADTGEYTRAG